VARDLGSAPPPIPAPASTAPAARIPELLGPAEVAAVLGVPESDVLAALGDGSLKGKKIGYSIAGFEDTLLSVMLRKNGLTLDDVTLINVNFSLLPALLAGQVDAVIGAYRNVELVQMAAAKKTGRAFMVEEEGIPLYDELILVARNDRLADARLPRFVAALERATAFLHNHPDEAWASFAKAYPDLGDAQNRQILNLTLARFAQSPGALDQARYARLSRFMAGEKLIKTSRPATDYAVTLNEVP
jgi:putative hydroxymethylpyrimidine transport system substrate-binding protein